MTTVFKIYGYRFLFYFIQAIDRNQSIVMPKKEVPRQKYGYFKSDYNTAMTGNLQRRSIQRRYVSSNIFHWKINQI